ncbi:MAG: sigma-70 family RNA polymerase sigma factor, partial [Oscillospiraceae bacterium]
MILTQTQKDEFVKKNLGLVHSCANKFKGRHIEYDDLFSAGCMGLLKAISGFDESRGLMFSTYAVPVILGEIKRLFRDGGAIKVSRSLKELSLKISRERERFSKINFREPTINELAETLCVSTDDVVQAINVSIAPMSLTVSDEDNEFDIPTECMDEKIIDRLTL